MAKTHGIESFVVVGMMPFPLDMLRYDECWPQQPEDSHAIERSFWQDRTDKDRPLRVRLNQASRVNGAVPTIGRWESFGWKVVGATEAEAA